MKKIIERNILNSATYEDIADYAILKVDDFKKLDYNKNLYKQNCIIYCKTDFIHLLFEHLKFSQRKYVLITHHSDYPVGENKFKSKPNCIKKWYAINTTYKHKDLITIPLGSKTPEGREYHEPQYNIKWFEENRERLFNKEKNVSIVYCNWGDTNPDRNKIIQNLKIRYLKQSGLSFETYCEQMSQCKFVISPAGNGLDNHRTWEALYLGCFPIVIKNDIYDGWNDLPIIQIDSYENLSLDILNDSLEKTYNYEKLFAYYWHKRIKSSL
jgi:hypothetical protein